MAKQPRGVKPTDKKKRNVLFVTLDDPTEAALQRFIAAQRIAPDRAAIGYTAIVEFLSREGFKPESDS